VTHLLDLRMNDGSRLFVTLPQSIPWHGIRDHVAEMRGAELIGFLCDDVTEAWIDFRYHDHRFTVNDQLGEYWFFVDDPGCPEGILTEVEAHFTKLLLPQDRTT
jgi:hypothetical protein